MKFTVPSKTLLAHLSAVSKVVSPKNTIAILDNFLFTLKNNVLIVTGTDQENTITARFVGVGRRGLCGSQCKAHVGFVKRIARSRFEI